MHKKSNSPLRLLLLQQGDPLRASSSGSGTPYFLRRALEQEGAEVRVGDCEPHGLARAHLAVTTLSPKRPRWVARFNISPRAFDTRSRIAERHVERHLGDVEAVIQYGSAFSPGNLLPYFCYSDDFTRHAVEEGVSWGKHLDSADAVGAVSREDRLFQGASGVFAFSERVRQLLIGRSRLDPKRVMVSYPGPNFDRMPGPIDLFKESAVPSILFAGREWERKGGDQMLRVFSMLRQEFPKAELWVVGPTRIPREEPGVRFFGYLSKDVADDREKLNELFSSAWVMCLPTRFEPFGMVLLEAMWYGLPVISTKDWAIPEIVDSGVTGYTVALDDDTAMLSGLAAIFRSSELRHRMGEAGRKKAEQTFAWNVTARRMIQRIESEIGRTS